MASNANLEFQIIVNGAQQTITNIKDLELAVKNLTKEWKLQQINTAEQADAYKRLGQAQVALANQLRPVVSGMQQTQTASANAGMALLNLNYVIRDSPYFFNNFAMGVLAVGNNLNPLIDSFNRLRKEALEKNLTTVGLLRQALVGGAGISIAFSLVVTAIQSFVFWQSKSKEVVKETTDELKKQSDTLRDMSRIQLMGMQVKARMNLISIDEEAKRLLEEYRRRGTQTGLGGRTGAEPSLATFYTEEQKKQIQLNNDIISQVNILLSGDVSIRKVQNEITALKERQKDESLEQAAITQKSIDALELMIKFDKDRTKELKEQKKVLEETRIIQFRTAQELFDFETGRTRRDRRGEYFDKLDQLFGKEKTGKANPLKESMDKFNMALETGKIFANQLGDTLNQAFMGGKIALEDFIKSLMSAIAQMLILRAVTSFLSPVSLVGSASGGGSLLKASSPSSGMLNKNAIRVVGKITADKNNFIANIRNADNYYSRNEEFVVIGR